jgi:YNFM family putative membrane transporter
VLLALAAFASQSMVRVTDTLLPQIAQDVDTTAGRASIIVSAYAITHGSVQLIIGPVGARFGNYRVITLACALSALVVLACGLAQSLTMLTLARLASGATAAWIIPLSLAFVGDVTPYEQRQQILARYLSGQILGQLFGQAAGGILGDLFGWRSVFFVLAALFAVAATALAAELATNPLTRARSAPGTPRQGLVQDYRSIFSNPWARTILFVVTIEALVALGVFTFVGADLRARFGLSFTAIGLIIATFAVGGLIYAASVRPLMRRLGQSGIALYGGSLLAAAYLALAFAPVWWIAPLAVTGLGLGFYMLHNTLQTHATQMSPEARGTSMALFASAIYFGQSIGVTLAAPVVDRYGGQPVFIAAGVIGIVLAFAISRRIRQRELATQRSS